MYIRRPVADDKAARQVIVRVVQVSRQHARTGLACRGIVFRKASVNQNIVELDAFVLERLEHQVVYGPESLFRKRGRTQSVLVGHHDQLKIQFLPDEIQVAEHLGIKLQFLERIQLIIYGRFDDEGPVAVDKQYFLFHASSSL